MSELAALQTEFLRAMAAPGHPARLPAGLATGQGIPAELGMGIYRNAYNARLREALGNDHPMLALRLGEAAWNRLCLDYIAAHPSRLRSLRGFGESLPAYLRESARHAAAPDLWELAAFERALLDSFDAADAEPASWDALQAVPPEGWPALVPAFVPSLRRLRMRCNSVEAWVALKAGDAPPPPQSGGVRDWLVWRDPDLLTRFRSLDAVEALAVDHLLEAGDFSSLCEALRAVQAEDSVPATALGLLARWCSDGCIAAWSH